MTAPTSVATRHEVWDALHYATDAHELPVPRYVKDTECILATAAPMLVLRFDTMDEAAAWAEYLDIADRAQHHERPGLVGVSYMGDWMGWRVLLLGDENRPTAEQVAAAILVPDRGDV